MVSTLSFTINWTRDGQPTGQQDTVYYYLKENGLGDRKCVHEGTGDISGEFAGRKRETMQLYLETVRPWLAGRYDPEIPSYETILAKEYKDRLAGRIT